MQNFVWFNCFLNVPNTAWEDIYEIPALNHLSYFTVNIKHWACSVFVIGFTLLCVWVHITDCSLDSLKFHRMPADEDREAQAKHVCHPLPPMDHGHRAHLSRGQQRWEVGQNKTREEQQQQCSGNISKALFPGIAAKQINLFPRTQC